MTGKEHPLPRSNRDDEHVQGHWLLARLGKRVLRPGGVELTRTLLARAEVAGADVLELAPGLGRTAAEIIARRWDGGGRPLSALDGAIHREPMVQAGTG